MFRAMQYRLLLSFVTATLLLAAHCGPAPAKSFVMTATTTLENSGLLDHLSRRFKDETGIELHPIVAASGKALRLVRDGEARLSLTHDAEAEQELLASGRVRLYRQFMWNEFVIVGPSSNPAGIRIGDSASTAFRKIHDTRSRFCSRSDESGTHTREKKIWKLAAVSPRENPSYSEMGQGMSALLRSAGELEAYTLSDAATFSRMRHSVSLQILSRGDPILRNVYAVTLMKPGKEIETDEDRLASRFAGWLLSPSGSRAIESFRIDGETQFFLYGPLTAGSNRSVVP